MKPYIFLLYFFFNLIIIILPSHGTGDRPLFLTCSKNISCGSIQNIGYPFWGLDRPSICGRPEFQLLCNQNPNPSLLIGTTRYKVLNINSSDQTITLAQDEFVFSNTTCPEVALINNLNSTLFSFNPVQNDVVNLTLLYQCPSVIPTNNSKILYNFTCNSSTALAYYDDSRSSTYDLSDLGCGMRVELPVFSKALMRLKSQEETLLGVLNEGFRVEYEMNAAAYAACVDSGGACGSAAVSPASFTCYCRNGAFFAYPYRCPGKDNSGR